MGLHKIRKCSCGEYPVYITHMGSFILECPKCGMSIVGTHDSGFGPWEVKEKMAARWNARYVENGLIAVIDGMSARVQMTEEEKQILESAKKLAWID